jgi:hypothetical protein
LVKNIVKSSKTRCHDLVFDLDIGNDFELRVALRRQLVDESPLVFFESATQVDDVTSDRQFDISAIHADSLGRLVQRIYVSLAQAQVIVHQGDVLSKSQTAVVYDVLDVMNVVKPMLSRRAGGAHRHCAVETVDQRRTVRMESA